MGTKRNDVYAVIMAGGKGERFWPKSRISSPKQLLDLIGDSTMIEQTVNRLTSLIPNENIIIITNNQYVEKIQSLLSIPEQNVIGEPVGRDTAPCVALATSLVKAKAKNDDAIMILLPADHIINDIKSLTQVLSDSADIAKENKVVTIGVTPTFPSTGYGYIKCGNDIATTTKTLFYKSDGFREKPNAQTAKEFIEDGSYKWNSGMFIWSVNTIYSAFTKYTPELKNLIDNLVIAYNNDSFDATLKEEFPKQEKISVDYAIMEKIENVTVAECSFDWDDVGSWTALRNQIKPDSNNNVISALQKGINTENCIIFGNKNHLIATIDVDNLIIVQTEDATLICKENSAQKIKQLVKDISNTNDLKKYL